MKDLLPIGSVVTLKEGTKKLMIMGRLQQNMKTKKIYDYAGCLWPEGYMDKEHCYVFDHEDIDCLFYIGLQDIEEFNFRFELDEMMKKMGYEWDANKKELIKENKMTHVIEPQERGDNRIIYTNSCEWCNRDTCEDCYDEDD